MFDKARAYKNSMLKDLPDEEMKFPGGSWSTILKDHSDRVEKIALDIARREGIKDNRVITRLRLSAILHDIGKVYGHEMYALNSAELSEAWLKKYTTLPEREMEKVTAIISEHSNKNISTCYESDILKDADILDQTGAMAVVMQAVSLNKKDADYYHKLINRLEKHEMVFLTKTRQTLKTKSALEIMDRKIEFVQSFIEQLSEEL